MITKTDEKPYIESRRGGAREGAGRKPFTPTAAERKQAESMATYGVPLEHIAAAIRDGIHIETLRKYFQRELVMGKAAANEKIGRTLYEKAMSGDATSMIWWTKTQMGWRESVKVDHASEDGSMSPAGNDYDAKIKAIRERIAGE